MQVASVTKVLVSLGALMLTSAALATNFECGRVACSAFGTKTITAIDDLAIDGDYFDVTFSNKPSSLLAFSYGTAGPGQPLTGVDAANALDQFYGTQGNPLDPGADGPGILADIDGRAGIVNNIVTAFGPFSTLPGTYLLDVTQPFLGIANPPVKKAPFEGDSLNGVGASVIVTHWASPCGPGVCAVFAPIAPPVAPELFPAEAPAALTFLFGVVAVLRSRWRRSPLSSARLPREGLRS